MKKLFILFLIFLFKISSAQVTFQKTYGGTGSESGTSVQPTADGGYIIAGTTGAPDIYLIKTDGIGDLLWIKTFDGTAYDFSACVQQTIEGGYIVAGNTNSFGAGDRDIYLIKTDTNGDTLWTKTYGGTGSDYGYSVQQTSDSGYIVTGTTNSFGGYNICLLKTDVNGNALWTKTYGGVNGETGYAVKQTTDGGYIVAGQTSSFGAGGSDIYLIRTDAIGDTLWTKTLGTSYSDVAYSIQQTTDGGFIIGGETAFGSSAYLIKTDTIGNAIWAKTFSTIDDDYGYAVHQTTDGGYIIAGKIYSFSAPNSDGYLIRTNSTGNLLWSKTFGGTGYDAINAMEKTSDGGYILAGSTGSFASPYHVYLIKTDSMGTSGCNEFFIATSITNPVTIVTSPATVVSSPTVIVTTPAFNVANGGAEGMLCLSIGINEMNAENGFLVSPNPSTGNFVFSFKRMIPKGKVEIVNLFGEKVFAENILNESKKEIKTGNISPGIYFIKVFDGEKYYCTKIIIE